MTQHRTSEQAQALVAWTMSQVEVTETPLPEGTTTADRPDTWTGKGAESFPNGECPIDWELIDNLQESLSYDRHQVHLLFMEEAIKARKAGDQQLFLYMSCQAMAALNWAHDLERVEEQ